MQRFNAFLLVITLFFCSCGGAQQAQKPTLVLDQEAMVRQQEAEQKRQDQLIKQQEEEEERQKEEEERREQVRELIQRDQIVKKDMNICLKLPGQPGTSYMFEKTGNICTIKPNNKRSLSVHMSHLYRILEKVETSRNRTFLEQAMRQNPMPRIDTPRLFGRDKIIGPYELR